MRKTKFQTGKYYHIYNRGVDKRDIFMDKKDYIRFLWNLREFNNELKYEERIYIRNYYTKADKGLSCEASLLSPLSAETSQLSRFSSYNEYIKQLPKIVEIICYCLCPNHYHFMLKQLKSKGISQFMHKLGQGYTQYFNYKNNRTGSLLEGTYKAIHVTTDEYLLYLSAYINGNPEVHKIAKAEEWAWSSYRDYLSLRNGTLSNKKAILKDFGSVQEYEDYVNIVISESGERKEALKEYYLE